MDHGIYTRFQKSVNPFLRKEIIKYVRWLRGNYDFPKKVIIYVSDKEYLRNSKTKELTSAIFFAPYFLDDNPHIKIAKGDFCEREDLEQKYAEVYNVLNSISHEIQHYYQWIDQIPFDEDDAEYGAEELTWEYIEYSRDNTEY